MEFCFPFLKLNPIEFPFSLGHNSNFDALTMFSFLFQRNKIFIVVAHHFRSIVLFKLQCRFPQTNMSQFKCFFDLVCSDGENTTTHDIGVLSDRCNGLLHQNAWNLYAQIRCLESLKTFEANHFFLFWISVEPLCTLLSATMAAKKKNSACASPQRAATRASKKSELAWMRLLSNLRNWAATHGVRWICWKLRTTI